MLYVVQRTSQYRANHQKPPCAGTTWDRDLGRDGEWVIALDDQDLLMRFIEDLNEPVIITPPGYQQHDFLMSWWRIEIYDMFRE